ASLPPTTRSDSDSFRHPPCSLRMWPCRVATGEPALADSRACSPQTRNPARERADSFGPFLSLLNESMRLPMNMIKRLLLLAPLALAGLDHAPARAAVGLQEQTQGRVTYISGGVSSDEADAMKAAAANYP